jgi:hypothetical protein
MSTFEDVIAGTPWRKHLLIATIDGARMWSTVDGGVEWDFPPGWTYVDLRRLSDWLEAYTEARAKGQPRPLYHVPPGTQLVPLTADEMVGLLGSPPEGVIFRDLLVDEEEP